MLSDLEKKRFRERNRHALAAVAPRLRWVTAAAAEQAAHERAALLAALTKCGARTGANGAKIFTGGLSPGCFLCGSGEWSCLFVNDLCNARCFFCPALQNEPGRPTTGTLPFDDPDDYVDYLERFQIRGVSLSGGEPLMTFDRTVSFLRRIKERLGSRIHLWLYTNGLLLDAHKAQQLADTGLDEIRFNIGAANFSTHQIRPARGVIPCVTVEVPAVPEHEETLQAALLDLAAMGLQHLNLHQIRCTPYNAEKLIDRGYTFLHGPHVTVLESELTALRLLRFALEHGVPLPMNYCSHIYRHRYQGRAARLRAAMAITRTHEDITAAGMIRTLSVNSETARLDELIKQFQASGLPDTAWYRQGIDRLCFNLTALPHVDSTMELKVTYSIAKLLPAITYHNQFAEIALNDHKKIVAERQAVATDMLLAPAQRGFLTHLADQTAGALSDQNTLQDLAEFECLGSGLYEYF